VENADTTSEFGFLQRTSDQQHRHHHRDRSGGSTQFDEPDQDIPNSPSFFSASSTVWGSNSTPSTPVRGTFTPVYVGGSKGGTTSPGMTIPIGAMSLSSRYETPRSGFANEEEEEEEEEGVEGERDGMDKQEGGRQVRVIGEEEETGLKMDVDVDMRRG
jgi:hypothetical protein